MRNEARRAPLCNAKKFISGTMRSQNVQVAASFKQESDVRRVLDTSF